MRTPPSRYRRSVVEFRPGQMGDATSRDAAGRDIYHQGADPDAVLRFLEGERAFRDAMATTLERMARDARQAERDAAMERAIDYEARSKRQQALDAELARIRRWLILLTLFLLGVVAVEAALVARELALFARAGYDVALSARP